MKYLYHEDRYRTHLCFFLEAVFDAMDDVEPQDQQGRFIQGQMFELKCERMLLAKMNERIERDQLFLFKNFPSRRHMKTWCQHQAEFAHEFVFFDNHGANVYHFDSVITEFLKRTDLSSLDLRGLVVPFPIFYVHFQHEMPIVLDARTFYFEGFYLGASEESLRLTITTSCRNIDYDTDDPFEYLSNEKTLDLLIPLDFDKTATVSEYLDYVKSGSWLSPIEMENFTHWLPYLETILSLMANVLLYFNDETTRDIERVRPPKERSTGRSERSSRPADVTDTRHTVYLCGQKLQKHYGHLFTAGSIAAHWRRGHWRNQAHGAGRKLHRRLWIAPTLIHHDTEAAPISHVYKPSLPPPEPRDA